MTTSKLFNFLENKIEQNEIAEEEIIVEKLVEAELVEEVQEVSFFSFSLKFKRFSN